MGTIELQDEQIAALASRLQGLHNEQLESLVNRLQELLEVKDARIVELEERLEEANRQMRQGLDWMLHERGIQDEQDLPVPRLEMSIQETGPYCVESRIALVLNERDSTISRIPLGKSVRTGAGLKLAAFPTAQQGGSPDWSEVPGLIQDLRHFHESMKLPAFVVVDKDRRYSMSLELKAVDYSAIVLRSLVSP